MITQRRKDDENDLSVVFGTPPQHNSQPDESDTVTLRKVRRAARHEHRQSRNAQSEGDREGEGYSTDSSL